jgi:hypothetical protein
MKTVSPLESSIQADIRLAQGLLPHVRLFRNNRGVAWMGKLLQRRGGIVTLENARPVEFGLTDGASDLIGLTQIVVTPEMVGRTLAVFTAQEVKRPGVTVPDHQERFVGFVQRFGGIAGVVRSPEDALSLVSQESLAKAGATT